MASSLIETMAGDFDPGEYKDAYREAVQAVIDAKAEGKEVIQPVEKTEEPAATDLLAALRASVDAAKKSRATPAKKKAPAKKAPARRKTA